MANPFDDKNSYKETINKMMRSAPAVKTLVQQSSSSEDFQNKQPLAAEILPAGDERGSHPPKTLPMEDQRSSHPSRSVLEVLKESGLSSMLDGDDQITTLISKQPKMEKLYSALERNVKTMLNETPTPENYDGVVLEDLIDVGNEIADAVCVLMILEKSTNEIEVVGELAKKSAMALQVASALQNEARSLLRKCINKLESVNFDQ